MMDQYSVVSVLDESITIVYEEELITWTYKQIHEDIGNLLSPAWAEGTVLSLCVCVCVCYHKIAV